MRSEGEGAHREDVTGEVSAALEVDVDGDLGVLDDGEVLDDLQLEVAGVLAKRRSRTRPAVVSRSD
jgi:adenine deaminase